MRKWVIALSILFVIGLCFPVFAYEKGTYDVTDWIVSGDLTSDGVQYSTVVTTGATDVSVTLASGTFQPTEEGDPIWIYFLLEPEFAASSSGTADITWTAYAKDTDATNWVTLDTVTMTNPGTSYTASVRKGYADVSNSDFNWIPFQWKITFSCNEANEGKGRLKNTSYIRAVFRGHK